MHNCPGLAPLPSLTLLDDINRKTEASWVRNLCTATTYLILHKVYFLVDKRKTKQKRNKDNQLIIDPSGSRRSRELGLKLGQLYEYICKVNFNYLNLYKINSLVSYW